MTRPANPDKFTEIIEIVTSSMALDGRQLDVESILKPMVIATKRLMADRNFQPIVQTGHTPGFLAMLGLEEPKSAVRDQPALGRVIDVGLREDPDGSFTIEGVVRFTEDGLGMFESGALSMFSVEITELMRLKSGVMMGMTIDKVAALGTDHAAFPELSILAAGRKENNMGFLTDRRDRRAQAFAERAAERLSVQFGINREEAIQALKDLPEEGAEEETEVEAEAETQAAVPPKEDEEMATVQTGQLSRLEGMIMAQSRQIETLQAANRSQNRESADTIFNALVNDHKVVAAQREKFMDVADQMGLEQARSVFGGFSASTPPTGSRLNASASSQGGDRKSSVERHGISGSDMGLTPEQFSDYVKGKFSPAEAN